MTLMTDAELRFCRRSRVRARGCVERTRLRGANGHATMECECERKMQQGEKNGIYNGIYDTSYTFGSAMRRDV